MCPASSTEPDETSPARRSTSSTWSSAPSAYVTPSPMERTVGSGVPIGATLERRDTGRRVRRRRDGRAAGGWGAPDAHRYSRPVAVRLTAITRELPTELLWNLTLRELRGKFKRSVLGWLWSVINPLASIAIYTIVLGVFFGVEAPVGDPSGL